MQVVVAGWHTSITSGSSRLELLGQTQGICGLQERPSHVSGAAPLAPQLALESKRAARQMRLQKLRSGPTDLPFGVFEKLNDRLESHLLGHEIGQGLQGAVSRP